MRAALLAATALTLAASSALAQITTTCNQVGTQTYCQTTPPIAPAAVPNYVPAPLPQVQPLDFGAVMRQAEAIRAARLRNAVAQQDALRQQNAEHQAAAAQSLRLAVGDAIRVGDCARAKDLALGGGDIDLAEQSQRLCQPPKP